jgi:hypothetical protein
MTKSAVATMDAVEGFLSARGQEVKQWGVAGAFIFGRDALQNVAPSNVILQESLFN